MQEHKWTLAAHAMSLLKAFEGLLFVRFVVTYTHRFDIDLDRYFVLLIPPCLNGSF